MKLNNIALILSVVLNIFLLFNLFSINNTKTDVKIDTKQIDSIKQENITLSDKVLKYELEKSILTIESEKKIDSLKLLSKKQRYIKFIEKVKVVDSSSLGDFYVEYETVKTKLQTCDTINKIQVKQLQLKDSIILNYKEIVSIDSSSMDMLATEISKQDKKINKLKSSNIILKVATGILTAVSALMLLGN